MIRITLLVFLLLGALCLSAQERDIPAFVEKYKEIAIAEMHRTGIPASVKLAQAILESSAGTSELATNSNNFFGLKCGADWEGQGYYKEDDDYDRYGKLIPSCFRVFDSPEASFVAHSEFLMHPRKNYRYGWLFNIDHREYKSWSWGLKESGYATNPKYAVLLIDLIEQHQLYLYDYYEPNPLLVSDREPDKPETKQVTLYSMIEKRGHRTYARQKEPEITELIEEVITNNGKKMVYARDGDTPLDIANRYHVSLKDVIEYNEMIDSAGHTMNLADRVYLERKRKAYRGSRKYHTVRGGQSMYEIAQMYGVRLEKLYNRNRMYPGTEPADGEKIQLRGMVKSKDRPKLRPPSRKVEHIREIESETMGDEVASTQAEKMTHIVRKGETLYGIANQYELTVDGLKDTNQLSSNLISPGQVLIIEK